MSSLSPVHTIGDQIVEAIRLHSEMSKDEALHRAIELLTSVGIPRAEQRVASYSFQLCGGLRQRAAIAMALSCNPQFLIADEPTTALDVTTQAQILELMRSIQEEHKMAIMLITHDLGVIAEMCDDVVVMYLGSVVRTGACGGHIPQPQTPLHEGPFSGIDSQCDLYPTNPIADDCRIDSTSVRQTRRLSVPSAAVQNDCRISATVVSPSQSWQATITTLLAYVTKDDSQMSATTTIPGDRVLLDVRNLKKHFPIQTGILAPHNRIRTGSGWN